MQKTVSIHGKELTFATITVDAAEAIQLASKTGVEYNKAVVLASLQAGGDKTTSIKDLGAKGYFNASEDSFKAYMDVAMEVNGLKTPGKQPAEEADEPKPATA